MVRKNLIDCVSSNAGTARSRPWLHRPTVRTEAMRRSDVMPMTGR